MIVGVFCGDRWHPADIVKEGITATEPDDTQWAFFEDSSEWYGEEMESYDVIVLSKSNCRSATDPRPWLTDTIQQDFIRYVEKGGGLLVIHAGTVGYADEPDFLRLVGGVFAHHPEPCPVMLECAGNSPLPGIEAQVVTIYDEHYFMEMFREDAAVFMTARSTNGVEPAGWTRQQGQGRVCVLTPGHFRDVWLQSDFQGILRGALTWCGKGPGI